MLNMIEIFPGSLNTIIVFQAQIRFAIFDVFFDHKFYKSVQNYCVYSEISVFRQNGYKSKVEMARFFKNFNKSGKRGRRKLTVGSRKSFAYCGEAKSETCNVIVFIKYGSYVILFYKQVKLVDKLLFHSVGKRHGAVKLLIPFVENVKHTVFIFI